MQFISRSGLACLAFSVALIACGHSHGNGDGGGGGGGGGGGDGAGSDGTVGAPDAMTVSVSCPGCPTFPPSGSGTPTCAGSAVDPQLVYPPDGVLLPPNMNVIDVQFMPGSGNSVFEIDFENAVTDVRLETTCNAITNTRGTPTGGCDFKLDVSDWNFVSQQNRGGDPVRVTVRGAPSDTACVIGSNTRQISFAEQDLAGGIYYWQSVAQGGVAGTTGGIFRHDFGDPSTVSTPFLTPGQLNECVGCHYLSHDGTRMMYTVDDADSDDEYGDQKVVMYNISTLSKISDQLQPGGQTFDGSGTTVLASDGKGMSMSAVLFRYDTTTGKQGSNVSFAAPLTNQRISEPDWSRDSTMVYFTVPGAIITNIMGSDGMYNNKDDLHFMNGSIWGASTNPTTGAFGSATELVAASGSDENNYYPAVSPDGGFLIFDRGSGSTLELHDNYNNPSATLFGMALPTGTPVAFDKANAKPGLTNSWPRWSPFVQQYNGKRLVWVTFSSTRDYGLIVQNENPPTGPTKNCYPPVSPEDPSGDHAKPFDASCTQPQIWMAAIDLDNLAAGVDPSFPAFWLPIQDYTAHNHIAQWVDAIGTGSGSGSGSASCASPGESCTTATCCQGATCDSTTMVCEAIIIE